MVMPIVLSVHTNHTGGKTMSRLTFNQIMELEEKKKLGVEAFDSPEKVALLKMMLEDEEAIKQIANNIPGFISDMCALVLGEVYYYRLLNEGKNSSCI